MKKYIISNSNISDISEEDVEVRREAASNPRARAATLIKLSDDKDDLVRKAVAGNPNTPPEIIEKLFRSSGFHGFLPGFQCVIASNPNTPVEILEVMASYSNWQVLSSLAINPKLPAHLIPKLASSPDLYVRFSLLKNPNISTSLKNRIHVHLNTFTRLMFGCECLPHTFDYNAVKNRITTIIESYNYRLFKFVANPDDPYEEDTELDAWYVSVKLSWLGDDTSTIKSLEDTISEALISMGYDVFRVSHEDGVDW